MALYTISKEVTSWDDFAGRNFRIKDFFPFLPSAEDEEEQDESSKVPIYDKATMPEVVVSLEAPDDFLKQRVMNLPESTVAGTHNNEEGLLRRLTEFRAVNEEDSTVLNYFDELEIHPEHIGERNLKCVFRVKGREIDSNL